MRWLAVTLALLVAAPVAATEAPLAVWFEIPVNDLDRATRFYEAVFGKPLSRDRVDGYDMAMFAGADGPEGALVKGDVYVPGKTGPILYFRATDIDATLARVTAAGGRTLYPRKDIGPPGWVAEFEDSEGNRIALLQPR
ncbi:VOC family protein [Sandarakinorhabdus sp.]|uniref:VOC family protein n=1 Tax=Sandarakinorhabdus sp. TaxID=1916663 RepID=UPI0028AF7752|nr:VOC family protein [Sandarakinorhabdus sp.]